VTARASLRPALVGAFTVAAGLVHAGAAGAHRGHGELALLFAVTAGAQSPPLHRAPERSWRWGRPCSCGPGGRPSGRPPR
jgi:hypothetical protein